MAASRRHSGKTTQTETDSICKEILHLWCSKKLVVFVFSRLFAKIDNECFQNFLPFLMRNFLSATLSQHFLGGKVYAGNILDSNIAVFILLTICIARFWQGLMFSGLWLWLWYMTAEHTTDSWRRQGRRRGSLASPTHRGSSSGWPLQTSGQLYSLYYIAPLSIPRVALISMPQTRLHETTELHFTLLICIYFYSSNPYNIHFIMHVSTSTVKKST